MTKSQDRQQAIRISNRQYGQLRHIQKQPNATISVAVAATFNQITLGGNKRRGFITETPRRDGIKLTHDGQQALEAFDRAEFLRKVASMNFSSFLNLAPARELHVAPPVKHRGAA